MPNNSSAPQAAAAAAAAPAAPQAYPPNAFSKFNPNTALWNPYTARALAYTSALAYELPDAIPAVAAAWGFNPDRVTVIAPTTSVLQAIVLGRDDAVVLAFCGTRSTQMADWMADFEIFQSPFTKYFAAPNVGDLGFCTQSDSHFGDAMFRFVNNEDIVTRVPPPIVPRLPRRWRIIC
jgi:hypothetical protein